MLLTLELHRQPFLQRKKTTAKDICFLSLVLLSYQTKLYLVREISHFCSTLMDRKADIIGLPVLIVSS